MLVRLSEQYDQKMTLYKQVVERQAQLTTGRDDLTLDDLKSKRSMGSFNDEQVQIVAGLLAQALQEEDLILLNSKLEKFQRRQLSERSFQKIGKIYLPLAVADMKDDEDINNLPIPYELQMFYDEINDHVPDEIYKHKYKEHETFEEKINAMPYRTAVQLHQEMRKIDSCQRAVTVGLAPSKQKPLQEILVDNSTTNKTGAELEQFAKQARTEMSNLKVTPLYDFSKDKGAVQADCNRLKDRVLQEFGLAVKQLSLKKTAIFRNGFKDMQLGIEKIREKYDDSDITRMSSQFQRCSTEQLQMQHGLSFKGDDIEYVQSYCDAGRRSYCPMTLHSVDVDEFKAVGIYKYGKLQGQKSQPLDWINFRPAYLYRPEYVHKWEQFLLGTRVDVFVLDLDKDQEFSSGWIEGFVVQQDISQEQVLVEIPNYKNFSQGTKVTIKNLQNIRISMDYNEDTWEVRRVKSIAKEIANLNQEDWWKFPFGQEVLDMANDSAQPIKETAVKLFQDWHTRVENIYAAK